MNAHAPKESHVNTVTVECATTGMGEDIEGQEIRQYTLEDVETWTARLRALGAGSDLVLEQADGLTVTLDMAAP